MRQTVVGLIDVPGSKNWNPGAMPPPPSEIVTVWPAMVSVPDCGAPPFAATVAVTVPLPVPEAGLTVTKPALLTAVHVQELSPVTVIVTVPPLLATVAVAGDTVNVHAAPVRNVSVAE